VAFKDDASWAAFRERWRERLIGATNEAEGTYVALD
jgi:hypothetical protein